MKKKFTIPELLISIADQMALMLREDLIPHPGELGTAREEVIREFFRKYLPKRFEVSTGFVFDAKGNISQQMDIIIYDGFTCPKFDVAGGKSFFPAESVVGAGQVKSYLKSIKSINEAFNNLESVKNLDRSANGKNISRYTGEPIDQSQNYLDQIFTFLFVINKCVKQDTMINVVHDYIIQNPREVWPNVIFSFDNYVITYCCEDGICPNVMHALGISCLSDISRDELLLRFYTFVARAIQVTNISAFSYWEYIDAIKPLYGDIYPFEHPNMF